MTRALQVVPGEDAGAVLRALRDALTGDGPAVLPRDAAGRASAGPASPGSAATQLPGTVPQRVALVIETSGSTGAPKRVALSADALLASAAASAGAVGGRDGVAQWLLCLPAHYVAGTNVLVRSIVAGTAPVIMPPAHFDPRVFGDVAAAMTGDARFVSLVPVQLARLVDAAAGDRELRGILARFDGILVGGQAVRPAVLERARGLGMRVVRTYGSSETSGGCVYDGVPIGPVRARAIDGLIELGGPVLAEGYLGDDERTVAAFHVDDGIRWYRTGDLGRVDADGRVTVLGRADNVIISGGEKVLLDAVERRVRELPGYEAAVVVAGDDPEWGQVPVVATAPASADMTGRGAAAALVDLRQARHGLPWAGPPRRPACSSSPQFRSWHPASRTVAPLPASSQLRLNRASPSPAATSVLARKTREAKHRDGKDRYDALLWVARISQRPRRSDAAVILAGVRERSPGDRPRLDRRCTPAHPAAGGRARPDRNRSGGRRGRRRRVPLDSRAAVPRGCPVLADRRELLQRLLRRHPRHRRRARRPEPADRVGQGEATRRAECRLGFYALAALAGLALVIATQQWWLLIVGAAAIAAAWFYTGGKRPYGYFGLGELFVFVFFGLVATAGTEFVQVLNVSQEGWFGAVAAGFIPAHFW